MTKKEYLKRLEGMLRHRKYASAHCPGGKYYRIPAATGITPIEACRWCEELFSPGGTCPCNKFGQDKAVRLAWKEIAKGWKEE